MPKHAVVDGSNIATEGRSEPSLAQLREAVAAFEAEFDFDLVTVIVDASFEHRVAKSEQKAARAAIDDNEIITPPAGVIGRGDTFILQVADRAGAVVLSNDSFQEFHGEFDWLFDEGRLVGGKPIPGVGWVYVPRAPVRGPVSRRARAKAADDAKPATKSRTRADKKPSATKRATKKAAKKVAKAVKKARSAEPTGPGANRSGPWEAFRKRHPLGSRVKATVEEFSSHGAYAKAGDITLYLPLRLMGDPAPRRARDVVAVGQSRRFVVHRYDAERQGIDAGIIPFEGSSDQTGEPTETSGNRTPRKGATVAAKKAAKKATKKSAKKAPAKKAAPKKAAKKAPAKKAAAKKSTKKAAKKAPAKKAAAKKATKKATKKAPAKKAAAKKSAKKAAKKAPAKKAGAKKAGAKKAAKKAPAKKAKKAAKKRR